MSSGGSLSYEADEVGYYVVCIEAKEANQKEIERERERARTGWSKKNQNRRAGE